MSIEVRPVTETELPDLWDIPAYAFAVSREARERWREEGEARHEPEWTLAAFVDGHMATSMAAYPFTVRLNGRPAPAAGVTIVGTYPEYRRRGLLRRVMTEGLSRYRDSGCSLALLWASFAAIYQRFGYGAASAYVAYECDPRDVAFREERPSEYLVRRLPPEEARPLAEQVRAAWLTPRNLVFEYTSAWWDRRMRDEGDQRQHHAICVDGAGEARGYLAYRTAGEADEFGHFAHTTVDQTLRVSAFFALDEAAHRAMWNFLRAHDLVQRIRWQYVPEDDITPDLLLEPRMLRRITGDGMWMRVIDVEALLPQRPYAEAAAITLAVRDELLPWNDGTFRLETDGDTSEVTRVSGTPDLTLSVAALSSLVSGYRSASRLARAGLAEGDPEALRRADRLFATDYAPHMTDMF
jgi:predicted acetyltransferase